MLKLVKTVPLSKEAQEASDYPEGTNLLIYQTRDKRYALDVDAPSLSAAPILGWFADEEEAEAKGQSAKWWSGEEDPRFYQEI